MKHNLKRLIRLFAPNSLINQYTKSAGKIGKDQIYVDKLSNLISTSKTIPIDDNPKIIISLTSYGRRINDTAPIAIATLFNQSVLPDKIILWLAHGETISPAIKRLMKKGLEVNYTEDLMSYKKIIPTLKKYPNSTIITVDDDVTYPIVWLQKTMDESKKNPGKIIVNRARIITISKERLLPYNEWPLMSKNNVKSNYILPTGVGGVLYPPDSFDDRVHRSDLFMKFAPHGDDLWLWSMTELKGMKRVYIEDGFHDVVDFELDKVTGLSATINSVDNNDKQFKLILDYFPQLKTTLKIK